MTLQRSPLKRTEFKRKPAKKKPRSKVNATTRADVLFSRLVRDRDHHCLRCGEVNNLQAAHIWGRRYRSLRWRFENCITLDAGCHYEMTVNPAMWAEWCEARYFTPNGIVAGLYVGEGWVQPDDWFTYAQLRHRALNDPPEKAVDALKRLKEAS